MGAGFTLRARYGVYRNSASDLAGGYLRQLVFVGATKDERFHAFDKRTGKLLWETALPAGGYATPATYEKGGRQYVVIAAGGGKMGTRSGDAYVAFTLPD